MPQRAERVRHSLSTMAAVVLCAAAVGALPASARQPASEWWPGATYDPAIPTPASVLGYEIGEDFTEHLVMVDYMRRLDAASDRVKVFSVGRSIERRELLVVAVSAPEHVRDLEAIRGRVAELRDPRATPPARAKEIVAGTPAVAFMSFANDGNESAAFEAAIQLAYQLAAGQDADTRRILQDVVTIIYPAHNPESHSRYVAWMKASATGNPDPQAQEHQGDWRMDTNNNHYQIDLNRDAVFLTQPESRTIVREIHRWNPVVYVDHHGNPDRFFFPPWARPVNPQVDEASHAWVETYGRAIAAAFDRHGWAYYTKRVFDLHYPGYFDSYPTLNGATGMTFETDGGGDKGLAYRLPDGRVTTLRDGILHHFTGTMATLRTTAEHRQARLQALYDFRAAALREGETAAAKQYVLVPGADPSRAADLVALLRQHHIEVQRATAPFKSSAAHDYLTGKASARSFPAGAYVIHASQPQSRLLRTILDRDTALDPVFLQEVREAKKYNDAAGADAPKQSYGFYDINAWSLPLAYGVEAWWTGDRVTSGLEPVGDAPAPPVPAPARARYGYLFAWDSAGATRLVTDLWREGFRVSLAREPFTTGGRKWPGATTVVRAQPNPDTLHARIAALAVAHGVAVTPVESAMVEEGRDLGDQSVIDLRAPRVAVVTEEPTSPTAYGAIWYLFEQVYRIPFTALRGKDLDSVDLSIYSVIVLPDGRGYGDVLSDGVGGKLKAWVEGGGTLVAIKGGAVWAARDSLGLTTARDRFAAKPKEAGEKEKGSEADPPRRMDIIPGAFVRLALDAQHYLASGLDATAVALFRSNISFVPSKKGATIATIHAEEPIVSGFAFDDSREAIKGAAFMWNERHGRGHVTFMADDVSFRAFLHGAHRLLLNAVLLGPTFAERGD